jgi:dienelactone hydrolase
VTADFSKVRAARYQGHPEAKCKVTGMWVAYHEAYADTDKVNSARLHVEKSNARILLIAGDEDEAWPAEYSVREIEKDLKALGYKKDVKVIVYHHGSHLNGLMPNREREKKLYRMIPIIGFMYKTFGKYRRENMSYFKQSEKEIIEWIKA